MKKITLLLSTFLFFVSVNKINAQWTNVNFLSNLQYSLDAYFLSANTGFVTGYTSSNGTTNLYNRILRTTDGGTTWTKVLEITDPPPSSTSSVHTLRSIFFSSPSVGFVVGDRDALYPFICKTIDGGLTWDTLSLPILDIPGRVFFPSVNIGYISSTPALGGPLLKTINGGTTWTDISAGTSSMQGAMSDIYFLNNNRGYAVTRNSSSNPSGIYLTTNGGTSWSQVYSTTTDAFLRIQFVDSLNGFVSGTNGTVYKTSNAGSTWTATTVNTNGVNVADVYFFNSQLGYATSNDGTFWGFGGIYKTSNGGTTWTLDNSGSPYVFVTYWDMAFAGGKGYAFGQNGYSKNSNAPVGINEEVIETPVYTLYPNPGNGNYNLEFKNEIENGSIEIMDGLGNLVLKTSIKNANKTTIDLTLFPSGIYYLKLITDKGAVSTSRISKM